MPPSRWCRRSMPGIGTACCPWGSRSGPPGSGSRSSTWASTTSWTRSRAWSTRRWRRCWWSWWRGGLRFPDALDDDLGQLLRLVVGRDLGVDDVGRDEACTRVQPLRVLVVEDDLRLAAGGRVVEVGVDDDEVERHVVDVVREHALVV